jgi:hypothetical protein
MARTSRNSHGGLKSIKIHDEETTVSYITEFGKTISVGSSTNGSAYSKAVNNGGWTCPSGPLSLNNQGIIKSIVWSISILSGRARDGDTEAKQLVTAITDLVATATDHPIESSILSTSHSVSV